MTETSESKTEQQEEMVNLFADGLDDKTLLQSPDEDKPEGEQAAESKTDDDNKSDEVESLPEKYKGKSLHDVIHMHQEVERAYGRGQNELGELRKLTDQILKQQLGETSEGERKKLDSDSLLDDPDSAINSAVADNPKVRELEAKMLARERADNLAAFNQKHPNATELVNDPRFLAWVDGSPTRKRLLVQADQTFDYELASEILTMYTQDTGGKESTKASETSSQLKNAKPSAGGATSGGKQRIYKRAELMRLRTEDPDRYERLQPEIMRAYTEGRVR